MLVQIMEIADELKQDFDPLDVTKTWPEDKFALMLVGKLVLDRNPENFYAQIEQAAFCPASIVLGVDFSADKLLQGRIFSYCHSTASTWRKLLAASCQSTTSPCQ
jgi:catalase